MSNADPRGNFVWHELLTSDTAGAGAFYPKVVSWKTQPWERDPAYTLWVGKAGPVGGAVALDETAGNPRWLAYVGVEDVHAAVAQAKSMGAKVLKDVTEMPGTGTYAVLADPQGAEFAVYTSPEPSKGGGGRPATGEFSWHELCTSDADAAIDFYAKLCGWAVGPKHDMGPGQGVYHLMLQNGHPYVGIFQSSNMPPNWMCYVKVDDVDKAANAAKAAGGRVINGPMQVPGGSWIAQILDPVGAAFAVHEEKAAAVTEPAPAKAAPKPKAQRPAAAGITEPVAKPAEAAAPAAAPAKKKAARVPAKAPAKGKAPARAAAKKAPAKKGAKKVARKAAKKSAGKAARKVAKKVAGKKVAKKKAAKKKAAPMRKKASARKAKKHR